MQQYDTQTALSELKDEALLPHPVRLRDMILRTKLDPAAALEINREFQAYLAQFGEIQRTASAILEKLAAGEPKPRA